MMYSIFFDSEEQGMCDEWITVLSMCVNAGNTLNCTSERRLLWKQKSVSLQSGTLFYNLPLRQPDSRKRRRAPRLINHLQPPAKAQSTTESHQSTWITAQNTSKSLSDWFSFSHWGCRGRSSADTRQAAHTHRKACEQQKISLKVFRISWLRNA